MRIFQLSELATRLPSELSGGQKQLLAIARATINQPRLILIDEPTANLSNKFIRKLSQILEWFKQSDTTVLIATHEQQLIKRADQLFTIHNKLIVKDK